jgi:PPP family 3-phenylpropionic acid transporter
MTSWPLPEPGRGLERRTLHAKLSGFYAVYYIAVGGFVPFWPLYLKHLGYSPAQIGTALAATGLVRVLAPVGWGWIMDRSGRRMGWIAGAMFACTLLFGMIPFSHGFAALVALHVAYAVFWNVALPAFDVVTLNHLARTGREYTRIRLWGSVGFVVSVAALGPLLQATGIEPLPWIIVLGMLGLVLLSLRIPDVHDLRSTEGFTSGFLEVALRPPVLALLAACFLSALSFAPFYGFFSIYLEDHHYSRTVIGGLWALGVLAEVTVFLVTARIIRHYGARPVLVFALATTALRWTLLAWFVDSPTLLVLGQLLHFSSFGLYHAVSVHFIHELFPGRLQGRGQALLAACSFGLGGSVGSYLGGYGWEHFGPQAVYLAAAAAAALGVVVARRAPSLASRAVPAIPASANLEV